MSSEWPGVTLLEGVDQESKGQPVVAWQHLTAGRRTPSGTDGRIPVRRVAVSQRLAETQGDTVYVTDTHKKPDLAQASLHLLFKPSLLWSILGIEAWRVYGEPRQWH